MNREQNIKFLEATHDIAVALIDRELPDVDPRRYQVLGECAYLLAKAREGAE